MSKNTFTTGIKASEAVLPTRPAYWSYSSLQEMEACPRRWMLSRAEYPELWGQRGYPRLPAAAALFGDVVHAALETIVKKLVAAQCTSLRTAEAVQVLRSLGGITAVVETAMRDRLALLEGNPRLDGDRMKRLSVELRDRVPHARAQVQAYLSRTVLPATPRATGPQADPRTSAGPGRRPAGLGAHPEIPLVAETLRLMGRVDLLTVTQDRVGITDYKTGVEDPSHLDQLRLYALLWDLDRIANPERRPATELTAAYPSREIRVTAPGDTQLRDLEETVRRRIAAAEAELVASVPRALPSKQKCALCQVRQLCNAYWEQTPEAEPLSLGTWFDYQGVVGPQNGAHSWWLLSERTGQRTLLLRAAATMRVLPPGRRIRLLNLRLDDDPEVRAPVATLTAASEVFVLTNSEG
ncbi:PD-(D/E)XK nuclease family protein [Microbispora sp. NPDC046933]|uniref:PD-(D/E)XK nuclease family protein n=1 Tax=Microbispora sp. NPDC046933 TaxID=3155618 RepID=UPI00340387A4